MEMPQSAALKNIRAGFALVIIGGTALCQQPGIKQDSKNSSCSNIVALAGNVSLNCFSLTTAQRRIIDSIPTVLNKILANQLDPDVVMAKLDEIHKDVRQIRDNQGWSQLTHEQMLAITNAVAPFPRQKMEIVVPNPERDTSSLAAQLAQALRADPAKWNGSIQTMMALYAPDSPPPLGIVFKVQDDSPALEALAGVLGAIFGPTALHGIKDDKAPAGQITIEILWKPR
jgi:hypothetical protein